MATEAPDAIVTLDPFHLVQWANDVLDEVRRNEWNLLRQQGQGKAIKEFKGLRWLLLRNWQLGRTARHPGPAADRCPGGPGHLAPFRLPVPPRTVREAGPDIRRYRESIEATIEWRLTNGIAESINAAIGRTRTHARGFHDPQAFIAMPGR